MGALPPTRTAPMVTCRDLRRAWGAVAGVVAWSIETNEGVGITIRQFYPVGGPRGWAAMMARPLEYSLFGESSAFRDEPWPERRRRKFRPETLRH
jgi:hypothetical protein